MTQPQTPIIHWGVQLFHHNLKIYYKRTYIIKLQESKYQSLKKTYLAEYNFPVKGESYARRAPLNNSRSTRECSTISE
jgi:hypothetical protein